MSTSANASAITKGTPRSSHLSPSSASPISSPPTWGPPKSPLPPHRLAKLANALGVPTPMPAVHHPTSFIYRPYSDSPGPYDTFRRSPTPSTPASHFNNFSPPVSKYLLHVIPPLHLPHETDEDSDMTPPPPTASGYHTQFRRGILVPVYPSLQSQLGVIAKEYALPSTAGLILYLVSSRKTPDQRSLTPSVGPHENEMDDPGPRLSEDIWKHLWTRIMRFEQQDDNLSPSLGRSHTSNMFSLSIGAQSTPFLLHESNGQPLRPFISIADPPQSHPLTNQFPSSPTTPSSVSDLRSNTKSVPPSSSSASHSDPDTPDTSSVSPSFINGSEKRANSLELPGLHSPSIIPVLAKVEFDIDRRKAPWYDPWLRSRKMNHAKRAESRMGRKASINEGGEQSDDSHESHRHIALLTGRKQTASPMSLRYSPADHESTPPTHKSEMMPELAPVSALEPESEATGYEQLSDQDDNEWSDDSSDGEELSEEPTARVATLTSNKDPLADVFGTDADTWVDIRGSRRNSTRQTNPNIVELALNGADLTALPSPTASEFEYLGKEEDEVQALLERMSRPRLSVSIPSSPPDKRSSSPTGAKKHVPSPLVLVPKVPSNEGELLVAEPSPMPSSAGSTSLAYLHDTEDDTSPAGGKLEPAINEDEEFEADYTRVRDPIESEKREGAVFDDLDLGLDPTEDFDEDDPHDRRRSQYLMKAQLDEIERTMAQLSPRMLQADLTEEQITRSPNSSISLSPGRLNRDFFPPSPRFPRSLETKDDHMTGGSWPDTPPAPSVNPSISSSPHQRDAPPSPPQLTVNGVTTAPRTFGPRPRPPSSHKPSESESRKHRSDTERGYHVLTSSMDRDPATDSPIIPLSPDPFGRFSSTPIIPNSVQPVVFWDDEHVKKNSVNMASASADYPESQDIHVRKRSGSAVTSRFSADSITEEDPNPKAANRSTLMTVNTIKKFWRKSNKNSSSSGPSNSTSRPPTPILPPLPPDQMSEGVPKTPTFGRFPTHIVPPRPSQEQPLAPQPQPQLGASHSQQQLPPPHPHPQQQLSIPQSQQLSIPFNGRNPNAQPIVAAQMMHSKGGSSLDRLHFDQESPYPTRRAPSFSSSSRPPSPSTLSSSSPQPDQLPPPPPPKTSNLSLPPFAPQPPLDKGKPSIRKSILKGWKSSISATTGTQHQSTSSSESRSSVERSTTGANHGKRPSILNFGSTRSSVVSPPPDIPPSPQIPQQFITNVQKDRRQSERSRLTSSSVDSSYSQPRSPPRMSTALSVESISPRPSMTSSRDSRESRPSFDASQFEIVSPKMNSTLSYPYHGLDHDS